MRNVVIGKVGKASVCDKEAFKYYRENAKHRNIETTRTIGLYRKIIRAFYAKIAVYLVKEVGGVFIKNLGYFTNLVHPKRYHIQVVYNKEGYSNFRTDNRIVTPSFFGMSPGNPLFNFWVMDRAFSAKFVKSELHKSLESGKKYKTYVSTLHSMYSVKK
jgi:hypothetical protein